MRSEPESVPCPNCGKPCAPTSRLCPFCGASFAIERRRQRTERNEMYMKIAGILVLLLVALGYFLTEPRP